MYASVEVDADGNDPISYWTQLLFLCGPFANGTAPNENPSPSSSVADFHFPFEDRVDFIFNDLLFEHQLLVRQEADDPQIADQIEVSNRIEETEQHVKENYPDHDYQKKEQIPRKSPSKRDRHTKIKTAHGLRDRRMRLSLDIAGRFFRLQDMLRFDKASKTIEWLLNQAKDEIERLERENDVLTSSSAGVKNVSSTSECEGVSGIDEVTGTGRSNKQDEVKSSVLKETRIKQSRKIFLKPRPKEVRAKARERARERTKEKIMRRNKFVLEDAMYSAEVTNYKPQTFGEESHTSCQSNISRSLDEMVKDEERSFHAKEHPGVSYEQSLATVLSKRNSPFLSSFPHSSETTQEHQFAELQYLHKPWEASILNH